MTGKIQFPMDKIRISAGTLGSLNVKAGNRRQRVNVALLIARPASGADKHVFPLHPV